MPRFAFASWTEATFHSHMHIQIHEQLGLLLALICLTVGFVSEAPRAFIAITTNNQSPGPEATLLKVLRSCLVSS